MRTRPDLRAGRPARPQLLTGPGGGPLTAVKLVGAHLLDIAVIGLHTSATRRLDRAALIEKGRTGDGGEADPKREAATAPASVLVPARTAAIVRERLRVSPFDARQASDAVRTCGGSGWCARLRSLKPSMIAI